MECKFVLLPVNYRPNIVLIETLWNVNLIVVTYLDAPIEVLIETLWNVNPRQNQRGLHLPRVLIETLWNVN